jgi:ABC-type bacteriocin/lantibiotic exporter with double-glycine peptidase domain
MILAAHGIRVSESRLRHLCRCQPSLGTDPEVAVEAARKLGLHHSVVEYQLNLYDLRDHLTSGVFPIVGVSLRPLRGIIADHAQVVVRVTGKRVSVLDPLFGEWHLRPEVFETAWAQTGYLTLIIR